MRALRSVSVPDSDTLMNGGIISSAIQTRSGPSKAIWSDAWACYLTLIIAHHRYLLSLYQTQQSAPFRVRMGLSLEGERLWAGCGQKIPAFVPPYPVVCLVTLNISSGLHRVNGGSGHLQVVVFYLTESPACSFGDSSKLATEKMNDGQKDVRPRVVAPARNAPGLKILRPTRYSGATSRTYLSSVRDTSQMEAPTGGACARREGVFAATPSQGDGIAARAPFIWTDKATDCRKKTPTPTPLIGPCMNRAIDVGWSGGMEAQMEAVGPFLVPCAPARHSESLPLLSLVCRLAPAAEYTTLCGVPATLIAVTPSHLLKPAWWARFWRGMSNLQSPGSSICPGQSIANHHLTQTAKRSSLCSLRKAATRVVLVSLIGLYCITDTRFCSVLASNDTPVDRLENTIVTSCGFGNHLVHLQDTQGAKTYPLDSIVLPVSTEAIARHFQLATPLMALYGAKSCWLTLKLPTKIVSQMQSLVINIIHHETLLPLLVSSMYNIGGLKMERKKTGRPLWAYLSYPHRNLDAPSHTGNQHFASHSSPILHLTADLDVSHHA
ncbi:uncharacterized protein CLUP02_00299 [Colletotrichum lupini]|uniref:Uncharacterized protein n=1 Tax=Colletotrichum lupini TaxID=145971 RepID=A0A9Q8SA06_9PEZI|nr:uncharacterized protein CLUP02_00299 [Colletotrichum lupini]UQC73654.1 hypothetical protein CLUP02_00299 [Colletotrichum lupini]